MVLIEGNSDKLSTVLCVFVFSYSRYAQQMGGKGVPVLRHAGLRLHAL